MGEKLNMFPTAGTNLSQERLGIAAVALAAAKMNIIWRETSVADVGVDGHFEFVDASGRATGRLVGVQVKSGPSFFQKGDSTCWHFYPERKHRNYWERYPLPLLLVLHSTDDDASYWADARQQLRSPGASQRSFLIIPKTNLLQKTTVEEVFRTAGVSDDKFIEDIADVLNRLITTRCGNGSFPISWFDLFAGGLTNMCRSVYFGMDIALNGAEFLLDRNDAPSGVGVGPQEHDFLHQYVRFLVAQHLADVDYADYLIEWDEYERQGSFVAPLTRRGRELVRLISTEEDSLVSSGKMESGDGLRVAQEGLFEMMPISYARRIPRIVGFQEMVRAEYIGKQ